MSLGGYIARIASFIGANTEAAPVDDTTPSGLNGRLQRIAQNLSTVISSNNDTKTKLDTANSTLSSVDTKLDTQNTNSTASNTKLDTLITAQNATNTKLDAVISALNTANGLLLDIKNKP